VDTPMPFNLAVLAPDRAGDVIAAYPQVKAWAVGGHSLGGAMAARFAHSHPGAARGLVLWAAYPDASDDLSGLALPVVSVSGSRDGLATPAKIAAARPFLPPDARFVVVPGGNHAQFGDYGPQSGDNPPEIGAEAQQAQAVAATVELLRQLGR
jgi:pimeloyl-ACP methyl ester carboxylesterase